MGNPTSRVLAVLELLQANKGLSGRVLAEQVGADVRSVRRYIQQLIGMGVPVEAGRGRDGGYALRPGHKLPPMTFNDDEALALAVGLRAASGMGLAELTPAIASSRAKLERVMPDKVRRRIQDIGETVTLDQHRPSAAVDSAVLLGLSAAARAQQRVEIDYRSAFGNATTRAVDVYGLAWRGGGWYAVGHCHTRHDLRSFRLDRVAAVRPLPASFGRPADFDILAHLQQSIATLPRSHDFEVRLATDMDRASRLVFVELGTLQSCGGGVRLKGTADDLDWVARELSRLPFGFRIVKPAALKRALAGHARTLMDRAA